MSNKIQTYKDLIVWKKFINLVVEIYSLTKKIPKEEKIGLISQMRRASVSVPSNIAEGMRRGTNKEFRYFLRIAFGSGAELETQIEIIRRLNFLDKNECIVAESLLNEVMKMLHVLIKKV